MKLTDLLNEELTPAQIKKCRIIWNLFKEGTYSRDGKKYLYVLNPDMRLVESDPYPIIEVKGNVYDQISIYEILEDGEKKFLHYDFHHSFHAVIKNYLRWKFTTFNIHLSM